MSRGGVPLFYYAQVCSTSIGNLLHYLLLIVYVELLREVLHNLLCTHLSKNKRKKILHLHYMSIVLDQRMCEGCRRPYNTFEFGSTISCHITFPKKVFYCITIDLPYCNAAPMAIVLPVAKSYFYLWQTESYECLNS